MCNFIPDQLLSYQILNPVPQLDWNPLPQTLPDDVWLIELDNTALLIEFALTSKL